MEDNPWVDQLAEVTGKIVNGTERISTREIFSHLELHPNQQRSHHLKQIANVMKQMGWENTKYRVGKRTVRGYTRKPADSNPAAPKTNEY